MIHRVDCKTHSENIRHLDAMWVRATYVLKELLLLKGPVVLESERIGHDGAPLARRNVQTILVLASADFAWNEYRRVGFGKTDEVVFGR